MTWLDALMTVPCQVITRHDPGDGSPPAETSHDMTCYAQVWHAAEDGLGRASVTTWRLWLPARAALLPGFDTFAAIIVHGRRLEADEPPVLYCLPRGSVPHHVEVLAREGTA